MQYVVRNSSEIQGSIQDEVKFQLQQYFVIIYLKIAYFQQKKAFFSKHLEGQYPIIAL